MTLSLEQQEGSTLNDLMNFFNLDPDETLEESLRLALMFQEEMKEATEAYMEMLELSIDPANQTPEQMTNMVKEAINAALITGLRAYRSWIESSGVDVRAVEISNGKDIPPINFHPGAKWPM